MAGGAARRLGGIDKAMLPLGTQGMTLLQQAVESCWAAGASAVTVAGPQRPQVQGVTRWVADDQPDGGPAAGIYAALDRATEEYLFITAGDQRIDPPAVRAVCQAAIGHDGAWAVRQADPAAGILVPGNAQPLFACVDSGVLRELLAPTRGVGQSPLRLLSGRDMVAVELPAVVDVDTWGDVERMMVGEGADMTDAWLVRIGAVLGVPGIQVPVAELLDVTREVAHGVERKAAPLTTFLLGVAVGSGAMSLEDAVRAVQDAVSDPATDGDA